MLPDKVEHPVGKKYPNRIGINYLAGVKGPYGKAYKLDPPAVVGIISPEDTSLAEALRSAGYSTPHVGKWHLQGHGEKGNDNFPERHGLEINIGGKISSYYFPYKSKQHPGTNVPGMEDGKPGNYHTDALTTKAIRFIKDHTDKPNVNIFISNHLPETTTSSESISGWSEDGPAAMR